MQHRALLHQRGNNLPRRSAPKTASFPSLHRMENSPFLHFRGLVNFAVFADLGLSAEKMAGCPEGWQTPLARVSNRGAKPLLAHDFAAQSLVCYTFAPRWAGKVAAALSGRQLFRPQVRRMVCIYTSQILRNPADRQEETTHGNPASANGGILAGLAPAAQRYIKLPSLVSRLSSFAFDSFSS